MAKAPKVNVNELRTRAYAAYAAGDKETGNALFQQYCALVSEASKKARQKRGPKKPNAFKAALIRHGYY